MSMDEDADAIQRCQRGDWTGLDMLMARYERLALRLAYLLTGDPVQAQDIVQTSFLQVHRAIMRFRAGSAFTPWLFRIVTTTARQLHRSVLRRREVSLSHWLYSMRSAPDRGQDHAVGIGVASVDPSEAAERAEERDAVLAALAALTRKQREAIVLRYYGGYSDRELAQILKCRPDTARQRVHEGLQHLEAVIRQQFAWLVEEDASRQPASRCDEERHHATA